MKKRTVGELQAMRVAWRFMLGLGGFAIVVTASLLLFLYPNLTPEQKESPVHKNDVMGGAIVMVVSAIAIIGGWKLRTYVNKCEQESGQSSKPFGWMP
jgi:hypothetical protein